MRPTRLELQGFASFRDHTVLDLTDAELFAFTGPTGAGKSSLIDGMTFALFGAVSRYGRGTVAPVIAQGRNDARVLLEFTADGTTYRVARRVQRTSNGGATTKEARLEQLRGEGVDPLDLAMGAKEVTAEVEAVLGLNFDQFCKTVVLPQGAFQEFLHATPGDRQDLLVKLLDLGVYRDIAKRANSRAKEARVKVEALTPQLEQLAGVTDTAIEQAGERVTALDRLSEVVARAQPELDAIKERGAEARAAQRQTQANLDRLSGVKAPVGLEALAERLAEVDQRLTAATTALERATAAREGAEDQAKDAVTSVQLRSLLELRSTVASLVEARSAAVAAHETAQQVSIAARKDAKEARAASTDAEDARQAVEARHGVHALRDHLVEGAPCPLCEQDVVTLPDAPPIDELDRARQAATAAEKAAREAEQAATKAEVAEARAGEKAKATADRLAEQEATLTATAERMDLAPDVTEQALQAQLDAATSRESALEELRKAERSARQAVKEATTARGALATERADALELLRTTQAAVADLGAPAATDELAPSWTALTDWAADERPRREALVAEADAAIEAITQEYKARNLVVHQACTKAGVVVGADTTATAAVAAQQAEAKGRLAHLQEQKRQADALHAQVARLKVESEVAHMLGQHLNAKNFEQWLLARGLARLVVGASAILGELSRGAYALTLDPADNQFLVIDNTNAGETRHARSLSGGETFLASLSLALSLAEHVTDLAAQGSARLESLFLDEGFGTLDADTLDVVAASIEELGATGRQVGIVTHVRDLAERVPTRFEVRKGPGGSTVERIDR